MICDQTVKLRMIELVLSTTTFHRTTALSNNDEDWSLDIIARLEKSLAFREIELEWT